ncbi:MAG TPA: nucleotidyltransferase domain-containing protein [Solirubrobacteraceae bacterium]|nr:nucleotidyltransferase domain-containing protein [Solirubrobacteraceae bacterium]
MSASNRRVLERLVPALERQLEDELVSVWLCGSRACGEEPGPDSDVDLTVATRSGEDAQWRAAYELWGAGHRQPATL